MIAMPSQFRPRAWDAPPLDNAEGMEGEKGKGKSFDSYEDSDEGHGGGGDGDGELPEVVFGVAEVPWRVLIPPNSYSPPRIQL